MGEVEAKSTVVGGKRSLFAAIGRVGKEGVMGEMGWGSSYIVLLLFEGAERDRGKSWCDGQWRAYSLVTQEVFMMSSYSQL